MAAARISPPRAVSGAGLEVGGGAGRREVGGDVDDEDRDNEPHDPEETFLDSLHLDRDQMFDFSNSEGHFLYLRQKPGTDATAYNLEVILNGFHPQTRRRWKNFEYVLKYACLD